MELRPNSDMLMVKVLMEPVLIVNGASQLFRAIKFAAVNERGWGGDEGRVDCPLEKNSKHRQPFEG